MSGENTNNTYTNVSDLPTMAEITSPAYVPVEDANKDGKKVDLNSIKPGVLDTTATDAQEPNATEDLSGNVTLHKVAKTGSYNDLNNTPSIPQSTYTRKSLEVSPDDADAIIFCSYHIDVNNKDCITAHLLPAKADTKQLWLDIAPDADDAIISIELDTGEEYKNPELRRIIPRRKPDNTALHVVYEPKFIAETSSSSGILYTMNATGSDIDVPTDWNEVGLVDSAVTNVRIKREHSDVMDPWDHISKCVFRIIADFCFVYIESDYYAC